MRDSAKRAALTAACLGLAVTGLPGVASAADDAAPPKYSGQQLTWGPCPFEPAEGSLPAECAVVTVPRDWADPEAGPDLAVSISRVRAGGERLGSLLVNPGGPGAQGSSMAGAIAGLEPDLHQGYDLIGMDPRGTGQEGAVAPEQLGFLCEVPLDRLPQGTSLDARDRSAASIAEHRKTPRAIAESCQSDAIAPYITTWQTAHDMDLIRALLHEEKLNYLGYSYGTWLGAKYAALFPRHSGRMILDSNVNWQGRLQAAFEDFPRIGQRWFDDVYLPWTTRQFPELVGTDVESARRTWEDVRAFYAAQGIAPDNFDALFVGAGSEIRWALASAVLVAAINEMNGQQPPEPARSAELQAMLDEQARANFGVPLTELTPQRVADGLAEDYVPVSGTRFAVACGDQPTRSAQWYQELSDRQGPDLPLNGWAYGLSETCGYWSDTPRQELPQLPPEVADNVLVVQGEFDPQTAYEQGSAAVDAAGAVSMVSVDDSPTHGQYAMANNPCVDGMVNVFLLHGSRPADAVCPSVPLPGEQEVFPVDGPVTSAPAPMPADLGTGPDHPELRRSLQDQISRANQNPAA
ncbi:alpha/beta hydrolase [Saccharopolyspora sp. NFXS83]|uniref:alpha/beta hydrolase n=1 Tax=Saccharopolyspora sp. NFXS83 TaxID=2993560 RepID=UPI00224A9BDC|nr:alpha/beta hydrolase [Saccharopolyspora sp. NFXS83]MCX2733485.1 alpha/beta hydrolase [Saccharopolyspora sp. NFXS83]